MRDVTLVILNSLRIKCHIRRLLSNKFKYVHRFTRHNQKGNSTVTDVTNRRTYGHSNCPAS